MRMYLTLESFVLWLPVTAVSVLIVVFLIYLSIRAHRRKVETGNEGLIGEEGVYRGGGKAFIHGELWRVEGEGLDEGDEIVVEDIDRMTLRVRKIK
jgi:membrane-bound serine protease (ClpP class)